MIDRSQQNSGVRQPSTLPPRLLSEAEFQATLTRPMRDIRGREDLEQVVGVIDVVPYLNCLSPDMLRGRVLLPNLPPAAVRRSSDDRFDHVLYKLDKSDTYAVVVVALEEERILGHYVLDLGEFYGP